MTRLFLVISLSAFVVAAPAAAKGPSKATITGPSLDRPLVLTSHAAMRVMENSGFWETSTRLPQAPALSAKPKGDLGPRYVITYELPQIVSVSFVRQEVYPFARGGPVTHVAAGQSLFDRPTTGGWFRAREPLEGTLVSLGLPAPAKAANEGSRVAWAVVPVAGVVLGLMLVGLRRGRNPARARGVDAA